MPRNGVFGRQRRRRLAATLAAAAAVTGLAAVSGFAGTGGAGGEPGAAFRLADGSVACALSGNELACRATGGETAVVLRRDGRSRAADVEVPLDRSTPVLLPAESWWLGGFSCRVVREAVACAAGGGAIAVAPQTAGAVR